MHIELDHLLAHGTVESVESRDSWKLWRCTIGDEPVVAILSGIGMINAAAATEYLIASCNPRAVVNSGCTGAHLSELAQGDVVIGTSTVYPAALQVLASGEARHVGFSFDSVTGLIEAPALPADPTLLSIARQVEKSIDVPAWPDDLAWDAPEPRREASLRPVSPAPKPGFKLRWPVEGKVTSGYGFRGGLHHDGFDISAKEGDPIYAAADGRVLYAGDKLAGYGNLVIIRHSGSLSTVYAHNKENLVSEGDFVTAGQLIGKVGETGRASGPHVHFEVREGKKAVDPSRFLP